MFIFSSSPMRPRVLLWVVLLVISRKIPGIRKWSDGEQIPSGSFPAVWKCIYLAMEEEIWIVGMLLSLQLHPMAPPGWDSSCARGCSSLTPAKFGIVQGAGEEHLFEILGWGWVCAVNFGLEWEMGYFELGWTPWNEVIFGVSFTQTKP